MNGVGKTTSKVFTVLHLLIDIIKDLELSMQERKQLYKIVLKQLDIYNTNGTDGVTVCGNTKCKKGKK